MKLPSPRGPLSSALIDTLSGGSGGLTVEPGDIEDFHL